MSVSPPIEPLPGSTELPDGRQTRIDFHSSAGSRQSHVQPARRISPDWWHTLTGFFRSSPMEKENRLEEFREFLLDRNYSERSCSHYLFSLQKFFNYLDSRKVTEINFGHIEDYNYDFFVSGRYSRSYQLQFINALSLYLEFERGVKVNLKSLRLPLSRR